MKSTLKALDKILSEASDAIGGSNRPEEVPDGFFTLAELAAHMGLPRETIRDRLERQVTVGKMEKRIFRVFLTNRVIPVAHYRKL
jgi:hypothetical protein